MSTTEGLINSRYAYLVDSTLYNWLYVVGGCWVPSPSRVGNAAIGVRRRLKRKVNSSR